MEKFKKNKKFTKVERILFLYLMKKEKEKKKDDRDSGLDVNVK